ncbi:hypothetical protein ACFFUT_07525 [Pseudohalocynthiibacter aestuariivivens]|uniref:Uncharacterized protein n=1 Tax=Pseudohalocynthiibacter aestuariivivens TaxID=1591409 RepID=A0ABV5JDT6_9RHOB|nr:hypothetical protein [Pseudohalocynthiibacter aestuariivivens]MBS9718040.1 hypothetical protein [Pseudohalocynthiibacter aestuariivivens]
MTKSFIAAILAVSLAITGVTATQAKADGSDIAKVLLGLAIVGGIAAAVDNNNDRRAAQHAPATRDRYGDRYYNDGGIHQRNYRPQNRRRAVLPAQCLRTFQTYNGPRDAFGARCLNRNAGNIRLPNRCARQLNTPRGTRHVYSARCLDRQGYRVSTRRHGLGRGRDHE